MKKNTINAPELHALSSGQKSLWFLQKLNPEAGSYNCAFVWKISGATRLDRLENAINIVSEIHPSLRTRYVEVDGEPRQQVLRSVHIKITTVDARGWTRQQVEAYQDKLIYQPFDLADQIWRWVVMKCDSGHHRLVLVLNHIVSDLWSLVLTLREISQVINAGCLGKTHELTADRPSYADFITRQEQYAGSAQERKAWEYWKNELQGDLPVLNLMTDFPRKKSLMFSAASVSLVFDRSLKEQASRFAAEKKGSVFVFYFAVYCLLLHRYTGQNDLVVGFPTAGRNRREFGGVIGDFINTLVVRLDFSVLQTFEELFISIKRKIKGALRHKDFPFPVLVEKIKARRDPFRFPIIDALFGWEEPNSFEYPDDPLLSINEQGREIWKIGDDRWERLLKTQVDPLDISMRVIAVEDQLTFHLDYNHHLFQTATVQRMLDHYHAIVKQVLADSSGPLDRISFLSAAERKQIMAVSDLTQRAFDPALSVIDLFERAVSTTGSQTALIFQNERISFHELNRRVNCLTKRLLSYPATQNSLIGLYLDRSVEMVVALLAVLKTGKAYVPLDPSFPAERIRYIIKDAELTVILIQETHRNTLNSDNLTLIAIDQSATDQKDEGEPVKRAVLPDDLAYVIYTSGSTGKPKGVKIPQRALYNFICSMKQEPGFTSDDRLLAVTTLSFDIAGLEIFLPLVSGGCLVLADKNETLSGNALAGLISKHQVTMMQATPATWKMMIESGWNPARPIKILSGGESLDSQLADRLLKRATELWNLYGPTETTIWSTLKEIKPSVPFTGSIGRPIANTRIYVLDHRMQLQPFGIPGDLYIGGEGLAQGYHHRPDLTREKFVTAEFGKTKSLRLYQTGDVARMLPDGEIEYLGRKDFQVKLRGYRIELGEIEARLRDHVDVSQALVTIGQGVNAEKTLVGYVVLQRAGTTDSRSLRAYLREFLPEYMIPAAVIALDRFPLTPNRKIDRQALPPLKDHLQSTSQQTVLPGEKWEKIIADVWQDILGLEQIGIFDNFFDKGGNSLLLARVHHRLITTTKTDLRLTDLYRFPTIESLTTFLTGKNQRLQVNNGVDNERSSTDHGASQHRQGAIAVIGMAGRFPGARDTDQYWDNLIKGVESISFFSKAQLENEGITAEEFSQPDYINAKGYLAGTDLFDAGFFGISPAEAELIDPQQRLMLECAWHALEDAGYRTDADVGKIGVYAGVGLNRYGTSHIYPNQVIMDKVGEYAVMVANDKDFLASRIAYKLNLQGPAIVIQTACSTSLVAVHQARHALLNHDCDLALAGGVSFGEYGKKGYRYQEGMILSADGHCRAFDKAASGTVPSQGMGLVVLKRCQEAVRDRDHIYAIIRGTAVNNDGSLKVGYTAPSIEKQAEVIKLALAASQVEPEEVSYIEAHGTGTEMGDPIEFEALKTAFADKKGETCAIGAVKTNIGHLDVAAGIAGLIKASLCLKHGQIPPTLHFNEPNPKMDLKVSPFVIQTKLTKWNPVSSKRIAGVSSFGIGGTNAHSILEEPPRFAKEKTTDSWCLLPLSARTATALQTTASQLREWLQRAPESNLEDVAFTLQVGRKDFAYRRILVCRDVNDAIRNLEPGDQSGLPTRKSIPTAQNIVFMFPGQGSQYSTMGKGLYDSEPVFRAELDRCFQSLKNQMDLDLKSVLFPSDEYRPQAKYSLSQTQFTQPAMFSVDYALARLWMSWGIQPDVLMGHSVGEYVAACLAGVLSLEDALRLVVRRGELISELPAGHMLAVPLPAEGLVPFLDENLSIAAINAPNQCVLSGDRDAIQNVDSRLKAQYPYLNSRLLNTSHAFHSVMMEPVLKAFRQVFNDIPLKAPSLPVLSTVTGTISKTETMTDPDYWIRHTRETVNFSDAARYQLSKGKNVFLEMGPGHILSSFVRQLAGKNQDQAVISTMRSHTEPKDDRSVGLHALGKLWLEGVTVNWQGLYQNNMRSRVPLPGYPFERQRFWIDPPPLQNVAEQIDRMIKPARQALKTANINDWFYSVQWQKASVEPDIPFEEGEHWLLFSDQSKLCAFLHQRLTQHRQTVTTVEVGNRFILQADGMCKLRPGQSADVVRLLETIPLDKSKRVRIIFGWGLSSAFASLSRRDRFQHEQKRGLFSLLPLLKQIIPLRSVRFDIILLTHQTQKVLSEDVVLPDQETMNGPARVVHQETPHLTCRQIDLDRQATSGNDLSDLARFIINEFRITGFGEKSAYRGRERWIESYVKQSTPEHGKRPLLKNGGIYWITGGLGMLGMATAEVMARVPSVKLVLSGRSPFPPKTEWDQWTRTNKPTDPVANSIRKIKKLEKDGAEVMILPCDVGRLSDCRTVLRTVETVWGSVDGIVHAAGITGTSTMISLADSTRKTFLDQFASKANALFNLEQLLKSRTLDFLLLTSSLSTLLGGIDYAAYSSANSFMNAFAAMQTDRCPYPWISVSLDAWTNNRQSLNDEGQQSSLAKLAMTQTEGRKVMAKLLETTAPGNTIVSTAELNFRREQILELFSDRYYRTPNTGLKSPSQSGTARIVEGDNYSPQNLERLLKPMWLEYLKVDTLERDDNFFELGGDSLLGMGLISEIRNSINIELSMHALLENPTISLLSVCIAEKLNRTTSPLKNRNRKTSRHLVCIQQGEKGHLPLFLFPVVGGHVYYYRDMAAALGVKQPIYGFQSRGLDGVLEPLTTVEEIAEEFVKDVLRIQPDGNYRLGGSSFGGVLAYEAAQLLKRMKREVRCLFMVNSPGPGHYHARLRSSAEIVHYMFGSELKLAPQVLEGMSITEQADYVERVAFKNNKPHLLPPGFGVPFLKVFQTNQSALFNYTPQPYPGKIIYFRHSQQLETSTSHPELAWTELAEEGLEVHLAPGNHFTMNMAPNVERIARRIRSELLD